MAKCKSCGARVIWARTKNGKPTPLNADPVPDGTMYVRDGVARHVDLLTPKDTPWYMPHFATCPQADEWRKPR